ncbi:MAG TPA: hypothetical protein VFA85_04635 [Terriglobales bacterium]|nr:hypothetical protein [Terriglobales bacterium]
MQVVALRPTTNFCIRTTMNICGDVVTDEMAEAHSKVVTLALAGEKAGEVH